MERERSDSSSVGDIRYTIRGARIKGRQPVKILCPFHEDHSPSYAVYPDGAKCFVCGVYETAAEFLSRTGEAGVDLPPAPPKDVRTKAKAGTPAKASSLAYIDVWHDLLVNPISPVHKRMNWFEARGFWRESIKRFKFGHTGNKFVIPIWYGDTVTGYRFRLDPEYAEPAQMEQYRYYGPEGQDTLLVRPNPKSYRTPIIITEGELDAYIVSQYGFDTITSTSGVESLLSIDRGFLSKEKHRLVVLTDLDRAGQLVHRKLSRALYTELPRIWWPRQLYGKDITDYIVSQDVSVSIENELQRLITDARREAYAISGLGSGE